MGDGIKRAIAAAKATQAKPRAVSGREMRERKERAARTVIRTLDDVTDPDRFVDAINRRSYVDLLGELIDDLKIRLETAEQEDKDAS